MIRFRDIFPNRKINLNAEAYPITKVLIVAACGFGAGLITLVIVGAILGALR